MRKIFVLAMIAASVAASAQLWNEQGDAGQLVGTGQFTQGSGPLDFISGALGNNNDIDMFALTVDDWSTFSATTVGGASFDTQLFLFTIGGVGIAFNDDSIGLQSTLPVGNGLYSGRTNGEKVFLALSSFDNDPITGASYIFPFTPTGVHGPVNNSPLTTWDAIFGFDSGSYRISLTGASFHTAEVVPEPFTVMLGAGALALAWRKKRRK